MSLATLHWRKLLPVAPKAATIYDILDAVYTAGTASTYYDGTARTPGAGSAWTWSRYQTGGNTEAAYASPPAEYGMVQRVILAGSAVARTPTMRAPDTWVINTILAGVNKNSGAFNAWDAVLPFTSGQWFGYWKCCGTAAISYVHLFESEEAVAVLFETPTGTCYGAIIGAHIDPESTDSLDAETDGRLYGVQAGGISVISVDFLNYSNFLDHIASNGYAHHGVFIPGGAGIWTVKRRETWGATATATSMVTKSGRPTVARFRVRDLSGDEEIGVLREIRYGPISRTGRRLRQSGADIAYCLGAVSTADNDCVWLMV